MKMKQISVFLENREGRLYDVCNILGENSISIRALTIAESADFGVLRMFVDKPDEALNKLKEAGFSASFSDVVIVEVEDNPGGLAKILKTLVTNKVNIEYMYAFVEKIKDKALLVFRFEDIDSAIRVLRDNNIGILSEDIKGV